jgi:hypothetical protein
VLEEEVEQSNTKFQMDSNGNLQKVQK